MIAGTGVSFVSTKSVHQKKNVWVRLSYLFSLKEVFPDLQHKTTTLQPCPLIPSSRCPTVTDGKTIIISSSNSKPGGRLEPVEATTGI